MTTALDQSLLQRVVRRLGPERVLAMLDADQRAALPFMWPIVARPKQLAPKLAPNGRPWRWWNLQAGRGFGKTRSGAEWVRAKARFMRGSLGAIVGQTPDEARLIQIEGPAGILACCPVNERPEWRPALGTLRWPGPDGATAQVYSGADPKAFRGPQWHWAWVDELAKMARARESFDNLNFGLRLEYHQATRDEDREPQCCLSSTPRPIAVLRDLVKKPNCVTTYGSTYENRANLAGSFFEEMTAAYAGTRLGEQELKGRLLDDVPGALWQRGWFDRPGFRTAMGRDLRRFEQIAVAIDPAVSDGESAAETGIIAAGMWREGRRKRFHTLADRSMHGTPSQRCRAAILTLLEFEANCFVVETNNGGDWIPAALQNEWQAMAEEEAFKGRLPGRAPCHVVTATRGKHTRAEPISTLYEQVGVCSHEPDLEALEDQLVTWSPLLNEKSPDRLDALVWALTYLSTMKVNVLT